MAAFDPNIPESFQIVILVPMKFAIYQSGLARLKPSTVLSNAVLSAVGYL